MTRYRYKVHDKLYDLTDFVGIHPGGQDMFNNLMQDTNITPMIYSYHKTPQNILAILPKYEIPKTNDITIKYDTDYTYDKYIELKKMVYDEIHEKKIPLYWSNPEIAYHTSMMSAYLGVWTYCIWNAATLSHWWMVLLAVMSIGYIAIVFHETSHYGGFKNQTINQIISNLILAPFFTTNDWKFDHNYLHHCFTNTYYDDDFGKRQILFRHSNTHAYYFHQRFQFLYSFIIFIVFGILSKCVFRSIKKRRWNIIVFLSILYKFGFKHTSILYGLIGFLFLSIAQLSHIQHECIDMNKEHKNDFLYNQVSSTMNYRTDYPITRIMCFGLDIQIEHHLFPNIPHSSLRKIKHIVRGYCDKNNIPYIEKPSVFPLMYSYVRHLYNMGNPQ